MANWETRLLDIISRHGTYPIEHCAPPLYIYNARISDKYDFIYHNLTSSNHLCSRDPKDFSLQNRFTLNAIPSCLQTLIPPTLPTAPQKKSAK